MVGMREELVSNNVGVVIYQATYISDGVYADMINSLYDIAFHFLSSVGVHNIN